MGTQRSSLCGFKIKDIKCLILKLVSVTKFLRELNNFYEEYKVIDTIMCIWGTWTSMETFIQFSAMNAKKLQGKKKVYFEFATAQNNFLYTTNKKHY